MHVKYAAALKLIRERKACQATGKKIQLNNVTFGLQVSTSPWEGLDFQVWKNTKKIMQRPEAKNSFQSQVNVPRSLIVC